MVQPGDIVKNGTLLIAGWMEGKYTGTRFTRATGDVEALVWYTEKAEVKYKEITYKKLLEEANNLGTGLYNLGLKGKKVAIISKNRYEYALSYVSILLGGMVAVPLDKDFTEIELKNALIRKSGRCNYI